MSSGGNNEDVERRLQAEVHKIISCSVDALLQLNTSKYEASSLSLDSSILVVWLECRFLDIEVDGSNLGISMLCPCARHFIRIASVDSVVK